MKTFFIAGVFIHSAHPDSLSIILSSIDTTHTRHIYKFRLGKNIIWS